jgi:aminopeptidase
MASKKYKSNLVENYIPSEKILMKYAEVLVNVGARNGKGVKKGDVVLLSVPESAKPLLYYLQLAVLKAGAHPIKQLIAEDYNGRSFARAFLENANEDQLSFFAKDLFQGKAKQIDCSIYIISEFNKYHLAGVDSKKLMKRQKASLPYKLLLEEKENKGKFSWTLALYPTKAMAEDVGMTLKEYWAEVIKVCYLNKKDPVKKWKTLLNDINELLDKLDKLKIKKINVKSKGTDLDVYIGKRRKWLGGTGRNIPSFEVFISPDCRLTEGHISFNKPLYRYGNKIENIYLEFKNGKVVKATASKNEKLLKDMIKVKNANLVGEFSLTDSRFSKITKFMGNTLYDENVGGSQGNTHIALGNSYTTSYSGNLKKVKNSELKKLGFNSSAIHTDIISTEKRVVTATLSDNSEKVIYKNGKFVI